MKYLLRIVPSRVLHKNPKANLEILRWSLRNFPEVNDSCSGLLNVMGTSNASKVLVRFCLRVEKASPHHCLVYVFQDQQVSSSVLCFNARSGHFSVILINACAEYRLVISGDQKDANRDERGLRNSRVPWNCRVNRSD
jgi:hypothetical protein